MQLEEMSEFFNARSERYDRVHIEAINGGFESKRVIAEFLSADTKTLIDFGIGTGLELENIFARFPDIEVTGLDIADKMLEQLRQKYSDKHIDLKLASYLNFDFGVEHYDAALSVMTLHHYNHEVKTELYRRIFNCLKQGGTYIECDYMLPEEEFENAEETERFYFSEYERLKREQSLENGKEYHYDTPCAVSKQKEMLLTAGFNCVSEVWRVGTTVVLTAKKSPL
jgi:tRNA (cmo5U34)-methyltransferase